MPVSPALADDLAGPVVDVYAEAERIILARIARSLAQGIDAPEWAERKLLEVQLLQRHAAADLLAANEVGTATAAANIARAWNRGAAGAELDVARSVIGGLRAAAPLQPALEAITRETVESLQAVTQRTLRAVPDIYRDVIAKAAPQALVGTQTRRQATQAALDQLGARGITGFVDSANRNWSLDSYVEMATRTACGRAAVDGHVNRLAAKGFRLVMVSDAPQECSVCRPFEGKVLSIGGPDPRAMMTLDEARSLGLSHPNCRHSVSLYQPGITRLPQNTADPEGDAARQALRGHERAIRAAKRQEALALDPKGAARARARVRAHQGQIRELVATTSAKRQPWREGLTRPRKLTPDPFARDTDEQLQERLVAEFGKDAPDFELVSRLEVEMDMRDKYAGTDLSEHFRRRNTALDEGFAGQSDEEITELIEQAVASGDPAAAGFVNEAHLEIRARIYSGKSIHRPVPKRVRPQAESKAAKLRRAREEYDLYLETVRRDLENATNGNLIRRDRQAEWNQKHGGGAMSTMLEGDPVTVYRYASEEVRAYFDMHPRRSWDEFALDAVGEDRQLEERIERRRRRARDAALRAEERPRARRR